METKVLAHLLVTVEADGKLGDLDWSMTLCVGNVQLWQMGI